MMMPVTRSVRCESVLHQEARQNRRTWVDVAGGSAVLVVSVALLGDVTRDTDRSATVGDARRELTNVTSLVFAGQSEVVVCAH